MLADANVVLFETLLSEPVRNGVYKPKEYHGRGARIVNMGELFRYPRLRSVQMKRVEVTKQEYARFELRPGDLIFARRSLTAEGAGKCSIVLEAPEPTVFESSIIRARPDHTRADPLYLYYLFSSPMGHHLLDTIRRQVAVAGITGSDLSRLQIPAPAIGEQRAIAAVLGALDNKIELNRRMSETLEETVRTLFGHRFASHVHRRTACPADSFFEIVGGGTPKTSEPRYWGGEIPWFSVVDTPSPSELFVGQTEKAITRAGLDSSSARLVEPWTTIISARGTVGSLAMAAQRMTFNQSCYALVAREPAGPCFVNQLARHMVDQLKRLAHGSVFSTITRRTFAAISFPQPTTRELKEFETTAQPLYKRVLTGVRESAVLRDLRDTLLPKLISGELRIPDAERFVSEVT